MRKIINNAINKLKLINIEPAIINLTEKDYKKLKKECELNLAKGTDYADGFLKELEFYNGIEIDCRVVDEDEADKIHPLLSQSHIASSTKIMGINFWIPEEPLLGKIREMIPAENGRMFNLRTLEEIL